MDSRRRTSLVEASDDRTLQGFGWIYTSQEMSFICALKISRLNTRLRYELFNHRPGRGTLAGHPGVGQESPVPGVPSTSSQSLVGRQRGQYGVRREHTPWVAANIRKGKARARQQSSFGLDEEEDELSGYCDFGEPFRQVVSSQESLHEVANGVKAENLSADEPM